MYMTTFVVSGQHCQHCCCAVITSAKQGRSKIFALKLFVSYVFVAVSRAGFYKDGEFSWHREYVVELH